MTIGLPPRYVAIAFWCLAAALLVPGGALGSVASVGAILLTLPLVPLAFAPGAWTAVRGQPAMPAFVAVFAILAAAFAITARDGGDLLYAANFIALPLAPIVFLAARQLPGTRTLLGIGALALLGTAVAVGWGLYQVLGISAQRAYALFAGGNLMPRVALVCGFLPLAGLFATQSRWRFALLLGPLLAIVALVLSGSRGALLAAPFAIAVAAVFILTHPAIRHPWRLLAMLAGGGLLAILALVVAGAVTGNISLNAIWLRFEGIAATIGQVLGAGRTDDGSTNQRLDMLTAAWRAFFDAPWLGHGWGNFAHAASPYMDLSSPIYGGVEDPYFMFHNDVANLGVAAGLAGVACWMALLLAPVMGNALLPRDGLSRERAYCLMLMSVTYIVFGLTDMTFGYDLTTTLYAYLTAIVLGAFREVPRQPRG